MTTHGCKAVNIEKKLLLICSSYGKTKEKDLHGMDHLGSLVLADVLWSQFPTEDPSLELAGFRMKCC